MKETPASLAHASHLSKSWWWWRIKECARMPAFVCAKERKSVRIFMRICVVACVCVWGGGDKNH